MPRLDCLVHVEMKLGDAFAKLVAIFYVDVVRTGFHAGLCHPKWGIPTPDMSSVGERPCVRDFPFLLAEIEHWDCVCLGDKTASMRTPLADFMLRPPTTCGIDMTAYITLMDGAGDRCRVVIDRARCTHFPSQIALMTKDPVANIMKIPQRTARRHQISVLIHHVLVSDVIAAIDPDSLLNRLRSQHPALVSRHHSLLLAILQTAGLRTAYWCITTYTGSTPPTMPWPSQPFRVQSKPLVTW
jgi:hypothetical protein